MSARAMQRKLEPWSVSAIPRDFPYFFLCWLGYRFDPIWGAEVFGMIGNDINVLGVRGLYHFNESYYGWTPVAEPPRSRGDRGNGYAVAFLAAATLSPPPPPMERPADR